MTRQRQPYLSVGNEVGPQPDTLAASRRLKTPTSSTPLRRESFIQIEAELKLSQQVISFIRRYHRQSIIAKMEEKMGKCLIEVGKEYSSFMFLSKTYKYG